MQYSLMATVRLPMAAWSSRSGKAGIESLRWKEESLVQQKQVMINEATGQMQGLLAAIASKKRQVALFGVEYYRACVAEELPGFASWVMNRIRVNFLSCWMPLADAEI